MEASNGDHVTWRELNLLTRPIFDSIEKIDANVASIDANVEKIMAAQAKRDGEDSARSEMSVSHLDSRRFYLALIVTAVLGLASSVATIAWLAIG